MRMMMVVLMRFLNGSLEVLRKSQVNVLSELECSINSKYPVEQKQNRTKFHIHLSCLLVLRLVLSFLSLILIRLQTFNSILWKILPT